MPLWLFSIRSLACRQASTPNLQRSWSQSRRRWPQYPSRSYSTALQPSREDDDSTPLEPSSAGHTDENTRNEVFTVEETSNAPLEREVGPSRRRARLQTSQGASNSRSPERNGPRWRQRTMARTVARFRDSEGVLQTRPATRGRIWSTANPYSLTRTFPFQATPEPTDQKWTEWERKYSKLASFYATYRKRRKDETPQVPRIKIGAFEWAELVLDKLDSGQSTITAEDIHHEGTNRWWYYWQQIALWFLAYEPERMIQFLLATNAQEELPSHLFEDSLLQLARYFNYTNDAVHMQKLANAFCAMVVARPERPLTFMNEFIALLMKKCADEQISSLFETVKDHNVKLHAYSWLQFTSYFAKNNQFETALDSLLIAHQNGAKLDGYAFRSNCTTILRRSSEQPDGLRVCLRVVSTLVDIGLRFNLAICNVIMLNAVEAGDLKTAFSVYHSLMERGLKPDEATFLVLLKGCRMNIDDVQLLDEIIRDAIGNINVRQNPKVATEILHCLALHHSKHSPANALNTLAEAYAQLFDLAPLRKLELPISLDLQGRPSKVDLMAPTRHAMTFMIGATIQHYLTSSATSTSYVKQILDLYICWRRHAENVKGDGDSALASLATTDHVANAFLSAFIRNEKTLLLAARVVRDMQRPLPQTAVVEQCKPTVQTWSIFVRGFTQHKKMELAEQVLTYMRKQGIEPNHVTWNTLITGYARMQDSENTVKTLRKAEEEGMVWDVWTHRGLRWLRDRRRLDEEIKKRRLVQRLDFTGDLKEGLEHRLGEQMEEEQEGSEALPSVEKEVAEDPQSIVEEKEVEGFGFSPGDIAEQDPSAYRPFR